jgi:hypothetical protein
VKFGSAARRFARATLDYRRLRSCTVTNDVGLMCRWFARAARDY